MKHIISMQSLRIMMFLLCACQLASAQDRSRYNPAPVTDNNTYSTYQAPSKGFSTDRIFVGGNLGLAFGSYTNIAVSPLAGYRFNNWLAAGVDLNFNFASDKTYPGQTESYTIIGAGVFGRVYPFSWLYLQVQPEYNHYTLKAKSGSDVIGKETHNVTSLLMGGGYVQQISDKSSFTIGIMYDVLQDKYSPYYGQPVFQAGVNIGL